MNKVLLIIILISMSSSSVFARGGGGVEGGVIDGDKSFLPKIIEEMCSLNVYEVKEVKYFNYFKK